MSTRVVLVGHCGVDAPRLQTEVAKCLGEADVRTVNDGDALEEAIGDGAELLLLNRELPSGFDADEGVELMSELHERHPDLKMMLISDYEDAQAQAAELGAVPGFGKADLGSDKVARCLREALSER